MREIKTIEQDGYIYHISYDDEKSKAKSNIGYTKYSIYHIRTNNPKWCGGLLASLIGDNSLSSGLRSHMLKQTNNSIAVALTPYHTISYDEQNDWYEYVKITPYDD